MNLWPVFTCRHLMLISQSWLMSRPSTWALARMVPSNPATIGKDRRAKMYTFHFFCSDIYQIFSSIGISHASEKNWGCAVGEPSVLQTWMTSTGGFILLQRDGGQCSPSSIHKTFASWARLLLPVIIKKQNVIAVNSETTSRWSAVNWITADKCGRINSCR